MVWALFDTIPYDVSMLGWTMSAEGNHSNLDCIVSRQDLLLVLEEDFFWRNYVGH
jgi:hypothetical protein